MSSNIDTIMERRANMTAMINSAWLAVLETHGAREVVLKRPSNPGRVTVKSRSGGISHYKYHPGAREKYPFIETIRYACAEDSTWAKARAENRLKLEKLVLANIGDDVYNKVMQKLRFVIADLDDRQRKQVKRYVKAAIAKFIRAHLEREAG